MRFEKTDLDLRIEAAEERAAGMVADGNRTDIVALLPDRLVFAKKAAALSLAVARAAIAAWHADLIEERACSDAHRADVKDLRAKAAALLDEVGA